MHRFCCLSFAKSRTPRRPPESRFEAFRAPAQKVPPPDARFEAFRASGRKVAPGSPRRPPRKPQETPGDPPGNPRRPQEARLGNIDKKLTNRSSFTMEKNRHPRHSRPKRQLLIESVQKHCVLRCIHVQGSHLSNGMTTFGPQNLPKEPQIDQN